MDVIPGCFVHFRQVPDVSMAYWDVSTSESRTHGIPRSLTDEFVEVDGEVGEQLELESLASAVLLHVPFLSIQGCCLTYHGRAQLSHTAVLLLGFPSPRLLACHAFWMPTNNPRTSWWQSMAKKVLIPHRHFWCCFPFFSSQCCGADDPEPIARLHVSSGYRARD